MRYELPIELQEFLADRLEGVSRVDLRERATRISDAYRSSGNSDVIRDGLDALAYAVVRMPGTFAATRAAAERVVEVLPGFEPASLLDVGAGPGATTRACRAVWPSLDGATLVDHNAGLLAFAEASFAAEGDTDRHRMLRGSLPHVLSEESAADLIVAAYVLTELAPAAQAETLERLWALTGPGGVLLLVEPGTSDGFARLLDHRRHLLELGGRVVAPCSHAGGCPLAGRERWCHFAQRLPRSKDHRLVKGVEVAFEDEKFGYLAFAREPETADVGRRILATPRVTKGDVTMTVCTPDAPTELSIRRSDKAAYKAAKKLDWGDAVWSSLDRSE